jgi:putative endonuclease
MNYYVYVLKSQKNSDIYVGSTEDVQNRFRLHNEGRVKSTKGYRPWGLMETRVCGTRVEAVKLERLLKTGQQKELLRKKYC